MVKWENDKNVYILGAALGALNTTISNEIIEAIRTDWRMFLSFFLFYLFQSFSLTISFFPSCLIHHSFPPSYPPPTTITHSAHSFTIRTPLMTMVTTASEQLGETPTLRAVKDQIKKLSTASSSSSTTTTAKKSGTGVKKPRATASAKGKGNAKGKGKGKKRVADDGESDDVEGGEKEGDEDEDEETMPVKKKQKKTGAVEKGVEDEDDDGEV
jgi:hypothetical protein